MDENKPTQSIENTSTNASEMPEVIKQLREEIDNLKEDNKKLWNTIESLKDNIQKGETQEERVQRLKKDFPILNEMIAVDLKNTAKRRGII